jgi:predicted MPP superfamily phosphohydrolase
VDFFVTSGVGEMGPRARLFNPPEVVILELKAIR